MAGVLVWPCDDEPARPVITGYVPKQLLYAPKLASVKLLLSDMRFRDTNNIDNLNKVTGDLVSSLVDFSQVWYHLSAFINDGVAPRVETAAGGWVDGARGFTREQEYLTVTLGRVRHRYS